MIYKNYSKIDNRISVTKRYNGKLSKTQVIKEPLID